MSPDVRVALASGYERMKAWAELLDRINVFPVADGDTGRNLTGSLAPLRRIELPTADLVPALLQSARGNSGNIGVRFLEGFLDGQHDGALRHRCQKGGALARQAVAQPKPGTMLTFFEALEQGLGEHPVEREPDRLPALLDHLEQAIRRTTEQLPELKAASVVDSGALGMHVFFEGFLNSWLGRPASELRDVARRFPDLPAFSGRALDAVPESGFCVDVVLQAPTVAMGGTPGDRGPTPLGVGGFGGRGSPPDVRISRSEVRNPSLAAGGEAPAAFPLTLLEKLPALGEDVVAMRHGDLVKVHMHVTDPARLRRQLEQLGSIRRWSSDDLGAQTRQFARGTEEAAIHVVTDAAGSLTRDDALELGVTLLDSYVQIGELAVPETCLAPADLYEAMRRGVKVSTSQASVFERHQHYQRLLSLHERVLYLCVGSFFTGNHAVVTDWQQRNDGDGRLVVLDSGAASGRLGVIAIATARFARQTGDPDAVVAFARRAVEASREYIFLDRLHWLAAGGRLSKTSAFFGDLLHMKPVVSPTLEGAKKVAVVRSGKDQIAFALERVREVLGAAGDGLVLLEFSDNREWLAGHVEPLLRQGFPRAEVRLQPFSLTSGAHMGPGTWAVAIMPPDQTARTGVTQ